MSRSYDFLVGTFNTPELYTLQFVPPSSGLANSAWSLKIVRRSPAIGSHSWLHLSPRNANGTRNLYATAWTEPPSVVAYAVDSPTQIRLLGSATTNSRSGYVCASHRAAYSAGGATGEVFRLDTDTGNLISPPSRGAAANGHERRQHQDEGEPSARPLQTLSFLDSTAQRDDGSVMDFGGLRHGAHSADLSPDGCALYVADIGRNCIWTFGVSPDDGSVTLGEKHMSPRPSDGPRHVWPHPSGNYVYCVQEHTSMVDIFSTSNGGLNLHFEHGVRIIPADQREEDFWADEVRTSFSHGAAPKYLYASTRGLTPGRRGYVAVYKLTDDGRIDRAGSTDQYAGLLCMYQTANSGGWANAIQPGPTVEGVEYLALTDSEEGYVFVLSWDGKEIQEAARTKLDDGAGAATAVWL